MIGANSAIGVAVANFFPTIGLSTLYGGASNKIGNVVKDSASLWNIAANLSGPIFQGGRLLESYHGQKAFWDETIASYRGTIVQAFREVADALAAQARLAEQLQAQEAQVAALRDAVRVPRALRDGPDELHRGARCRGAALPRRGQPRADAARSAGGRREPLQGARRRLAGAGRAGRSAMTSREGTVHGSARSPLTAGGAATARPLSK